MIPELQNRSVISVVCGYNHFGALTSFGKLLTWGKYSGGVLGLGDVRKLPAGPPRGHAEELARAKAHEPVPDVTIPTEVRFDHYERSEGEGKVERYCFAVAADANQTAALVVELSGSNDVHKNALQHSSAPGNEP